MSNLTDTSISQRQIYILSLLSENPKGYTVEEIYSKLEKWDIEVSKRTLYRDIDELSLNYAIGEEERGGKTYYYADKYTLKNVDLTIADLAGLAFARELLGSYCHIKMGEEAINLIDKIVKNSTDLNEKQFRALCGQFTTVVGRGNKDKVEGEIVQEVTRAIDNRNKISITYHSFSGDEVTERIIHPYRIVMLDGYMSVEAYCELRKEIRHFRLARIDKYKVLDKHFDESEMNDYMKDEPFLKLTGGKPEEMELLFTGNGARYVMEYEKLRADKLSDESDGLHFFSNVPIGEDVIRWVRSYGPDVSVIKPTWLKDKLHDEAVELSKR